MATVQTIWTELYRPDTLSGYVFSSLQQQSQIEKWINEKQINHILLEGPTGTGKTTLAKILIKALNIHKYDLLEINASRENSVDDMRNKITNFISTMPFGDMKIVLLDECLEENTTVTILRDGTVQHIPIKDLKDDTDLVKTFCIKTNTILWKPFSLFYKGIQDLLEIEFENNEKVLCTPTHKWYVKDENGNTIVVKAKDLYKYNHILTT